jgi:hypothetical protein
LKLSDPVEEFNEKDLYKRWWNGDVFIEDENIYSSDLKELETIIRIPWKNISLIDAELILRKKKCLFDSQVKIKYSEIKSQFDSQLSKSSNQKILLEKKIEAIEKLINKKLRTDGNYFFLDNNHLSISFEYHEYQLLTHYLDFIKLKGNNFTYYNIISPNSKFYKSSYITVEVLAEALIQFQNELKSEFFNRYPNEKNQDSSIPMIFTSNEAKAFFTQCLFEIKYEPLYKDTFVMYLFQFSRRNRIINEKCQELQFKEYFKDEFPGIPLCNKLKRYNKPPTKKIENQFKIILEQFKTR